MSAVGHAGASAREKHGELTNAWRRRHRVLFALLGALCGAAVLASYLAGQAWPAISWAAGLLGGVALAFWVAARESPPGWIDNWRAGADGEELTAKALRELEAEGWVAIHDVRDGRGNVDHLLVGVGGVYVLDSKTTDGTVSVDGGEARVRRMEDHDLGYSHRHGNVRRLALATHDRVRSATRINVWVTPVIVFWADFPQRMVDDGCVYVHGDELAAWLRARPQSIAPSRVPQVADAVRTAWAAESTR